MFVLTQLATIARNKPGYLRQHPKLVTQKAEPILKEQLARQSNDAKELLKRMCVLRVGITVEGLTFLRLYQNEDNAAEVSASSEEIQATQTLVDRLVESSLIQRRYDERQLEDRMICIDSLWSFSKGTFRLSCQS